VLDRLARVIIAAIIDAAEEIRDPLDGLVGKTTADPGAPFVPDALERLRALKEDDRAAFEALRAQLKKDCEARCAGSSGDFLPPSPPGNKATAGVRTSAQRTVAGWVSDAQVLRNHAIIRKYSLSPASRRR
jgi:hypothetical protein